MIKFLVPPLVKRKVHTVRNNSMFTTGKTCNAKIVKDIYSKRKYNFAAYNMVDKQGLNWNLKRTMSFSIETFSPSSLWHQMIDLA